MLPNVSQLTSQLRMLPDPALKQAAMMYKNDPYILPMIISEDAARKQMRMAAQAQMTGQQPPKVVDQAVASIGQMPQMPMPPQAAPAGLPTLPTPNMARMADGGIAGYPDEEEIGMAEGGVARYNGATGSVTSALDQAQAPIMQSLQGLQAQLSNAEQMLAAAAKSGDPQSLNYYAQAVQALRSQISNIATQNFGNRAPEVMGSLTAAPAGAATRQGKTGIADIDVGPSVAPAPQPTPAPAPQPGPGKRPTAGPAAAASAAPAPAMAQPTAAGAKETAAQFLDRKAIEDAVKVYGTDEAAAIADARTRMQGALKRDGKAYAGLEALLKKEEEGSKGEMEQAKAFALINAGLAMMAGGSPNALQNIGKGAAAGMAGYAESVQGFKKAAKERQRALADIENARRAEERDDTKLMLQFEDKADDRMANARKFGISAIMDAGVKNAEIAARIYDTQVTQAGALQREQLGAASRERIAAADIAARKEIDRTPAEVRLMEWLRDPENRKLFSEVQGIKQAPKTRQELMEQWSKNFMLQQKFPNFDDFVMVMGAASSSAPGSVPPPGAVKLKPGQ